MTSVVLLHADRVLAQRLASTIAAAPDFEVTGVADSLPALREVLADGLPDVLIVDLMLRASHVHALLHSLRGHGQAGRPLILVLTMAADDARLIDALRHGADGYFVHTRSAQSLPAAMRQLVNGEATMSPQIARQVRAEFEDRGWAESGFGEPAAYEPVRLSDSDQLLLQWTAEGYLVGEVAEGLRVSPTAVAVRMRTIYRKWQTDGRAMGEGPRSRASPSETIGLEHGLEARA